MALDDIVFQEGEIQNFLVEIVSGTLNSPDDVLINSSTNNDLMVFEIGNTKIKKIRIYSAGSNTKQGNNNNIR